MDFKELFQSADWKKEKHVPVIDAPDKAKKGEMIKVMAVVGKEIPHPNETKHHIRWIAFHFLPKGEKFPYEIGRLELGTHGESVNGPDTSMVYADSAGGVGFRTDKSGTIFASSYCNIHGLWQSSKEITIE